MFSPNCSGFTSFDFFALVLCRFPIIYSILMEYQPNLKLEYSNWTKGLEKWKWRVRTGGQSQKKCQTAWDGNPSSHVKTRKLCLKWRQCCRTWHASFTLLHVLQSGMETLPKAQRTRGSSSYHKFKHKYWSNFIFRISTKHQLQNPNQTSAFS